MRTGRSRSRRRSRSRAWRSRGPSGRSTARWITQARARHTATATARVAARERYGCTDSMTHRPQDECTR
ncbi:Uncharacterised protein [Mycobacteroides abscessus]|nr:Uncharacterised protein [Mycobacteroides abscessus]